MPMQATTTTPLFSAALRPDGALRLTGGWIALVLSATAVAPFMLAVPEIVLPAGVAFALTGTGLAGLGLRQSRRRRVTQQVTLWADQLEIVSVDSKGAKSLRRFDPAAIRMLLKRDENEKVLSIALRHGDERIELGDFLSLDDRGSFARAFGTALRRARRH